MNGPVSPAGASGYPLAIHWPGPLGTACENAPQVGKWMPGGSGVEAAIPGGFPPTRPPTHSTTRHQAQPRPGGQVDRVNTPPGNTSARRCRAVRTVHPPRSNRPPTTTPGRPTMTPLDITGRVLAVLAALALLTAAAVAVLLWRAVLPVILIAALAVTLGMVRTLALGGFAALAALRGLMLALDRAGTAVPTPRLRTARPSAHTR
ncbi:hypothetical protein SACE_0465 [Saccharopolyspora erythraea prophage pSE101]|uniref:Uncharacterized protein n=2 Tax=Saccharopolyspora erythraea TaxID=1836 RepID=A4F6Y9_SACEN|nr:hypothetical protein SACE_0465 [Saccharopolyspora erythraea NRRL 2338]